VHKMRTPQVIETRWMNRVIVYWIPALFIVYGVAEMADLVSREVTIGQSLMSIGIGVLFVLACEIFIFGFRIELFEDRLIYRYRGPPLVAEKTIRRTDISQYKFEAAIRSDHKPWCSVEVITQVAGIEERTLVNLTSFSRADIRAVLDWLSSVNTAD
jgi:hypothetical protein